MTDHAVALSRRENLGTRPNPNRSSDYLVTLGGHLRDRDGHDGPNVEIRYVPDQRIVGPDDWAAYLQAVAAQGWPTLEDLARTLLDDANNELVPRWISIIVSEDAGGESGARHRVMIEDRQPKWANPELLARLAT